MHQGRMFSIQFRYRRSWPSGMIRMRPSLTAAMAGLASSSIAMNHCRLMSGSMRSPDRWECGTSCT
jgi:hypothetical protein